MRPAASVRIGVLLSVALMAAGPLRGSQGGMEPLPALGLGVSWRQGEAPALPSPGEEDDPLFLRLVVPRERLQGEPGGPVDLAVLQRMLRRATGSRIILCLTGERPPDPEDPTALRAWLDLVRSVAEGVGERVQIFQVWDAPDAPGGWPGPEGARVYAFLYRSTAVTIRSVLPRARVLPGSLRRGSRDYLEELYDDGIGPYADAVALDAREGLDLEGMRSLVLSRDTASPIWLTGMPVASGEALLGAAARGAAAGASLILFGAVDPGELESVHRFLPGSMAPMPSSGARFLGPGGAPLDVESQGFVDPEGVRVLLAYRPLNREPPTARLVLDTDRVREPLLLDPMGGGTRDPGVYIPDPASGSTRLDVPLGPGWRALVYRRLRDAAGEGLSGSLEVSGVAESTVEEILAAHQAFQAAQDDKLAAYMADSQMDLHFQLGAGRSLDVTFLQTFYYRSGAGSEWELEQMLINGVRWRSKKIPRFPFVQPDKVVTLPLDIHLDRRYAYELLGIEEVDGYPTWKIGFEPLDPDAGLYRGTVWIARRTYARVRMAVRQRGLEPPFVSNEEVNHYVPVLGPDGTEHWVLAKIIGAQLYTVSGRSFVVNREVYFSDFRINPADFDQRQREAYASDHRILRDTDQGYRWLEKGPEGERRVDEKMNRDQLFWLGGVFYNRAADFPVPLAGVNYFSFDVRGSGTQMNVFFAGALLALNATYPDVGGTPLEIGGDVFGQAFALTDRLRFDGEEFEAGNVERRTQTVSPFLAAPLGNFWRVTGEYEFAWDQFGRTDDTADDFRIPTDTAVHTLGLRLNFNRKAWSLVLDGARSRRAEWEPWGTPEEQAAFDPDTREYLRWGATLAKELYLPFFQKLRFEGEWVAGEDLDRFSKYQFGFFSGPGLRGFSGSGIRFDQGGIARIQYSFNLLEAMRFSVDLGHARVLDRADDQGYTSHTGLGLSGNFVGPWGTLMNLSWGIALDSDAPGVRGEQEIQFFFLKLF